MQGVYLLRGPPGPPNVHASRAPGAEVLARSIPPAPIVFVEVAEEPRIPGQDVWIVVPSNMWQPQQAATMCAALRGHAVALPRAPAAQSSNNRPAASVTWKS